LGHAEFALARKAALVADYGTVEIPLEPNWTRRALPIVCLAAASLVCFQAGKFWLADHRVESQNLEMIVRGVALVPGNADAWDRLGRYRQYSFGEPDPSEAIADFKSAVEKDPYSANYWMDLATSYEAADDNSHAREAYLRARDAYPISAQVAWNYGNFLLRQSEVSEGYEEIGLAVRTDPSLLPLAISRVWRSSEDPGVLLDKVLPANVEAYSQALSFFESIHKAEPGIEVWRRLMALGKPLPLPRSFPFFEELIHEDRADDARRAWLQALSAAGLPHEEPANHSLVWDGTFTGDFANGGLGWRWDSPLGASIDFDVAPPAVGGRSVRVEFGGGANIGLAWPSQFVPVEPNKTYHFRASIRTDHITTESGMRFSIADPRHPAEVNLFTENLTGTNLWTEANTDVTTGADTHFLQIRLYRNPSRLFDNKLSGAVWIAGISLVSVDAPAERHTK
jgi:tetratricopeptide (TPR) repeat protein